MDISQKKWNEYSKWVDSENEKNKPERDMMDANLDNYLKSGIVGLMKIKYDSLYMEKTYVGCMEYFRNKKNFLKRKK